MSKKPQRAPIDLKIVTIITIAAAMIVFVATHFLGYRPDTPAEEAIELVLEQQTGLSLDLSPGEE